MRKKELRMFLLYHVQWHGCQKFKIEYSCSHEVSNYEFKLKSNNSNDRISIRNLAKLKTFSLTTNKTKMYMVKYRIYKGIMLLIAICNALSNAIILRGFLIRTVDNFEHLGSFKFLKSHEYQFIIMYTMMNNYTTI